MRTDSEEWRATCEARWCLRQDRKARHRYYARVREARGSAAVRKLIEDVKREYERGAA